MEDDIHFLANHFNKSLEDPLIKQAYQNVEKYKKENGTKKIIDIISREYRPSNIEPNTVGAYLWGSSQNYYGDINKHCSLLFTNSLEYDENRKDCPYSLWYYDYYHDKLKKKTNTSATKGIVFVKDNWTGFNHDEIKLLKSSGITSVSVLNTFGSKHKTVLETTLIDNLPVSQNHIEIENEKSFPYWIFLVIIILLYLIIKI